MLCIFFLLTTAMSWAGEYSALGLRFQLGRDLVPSKAYRPGTGDYMWPSMSGPRLNLVLHETAPEATLEQELDFAFGEAHKPEWTAQREGRAMSGGQRFRATFVELKGRRIFIAALSRSNPALPESELEAIVGKVAATLH